MISHAYCQWRSERDQKWRRWGLTIGRCLILVLLLIVPRPAAALDPQRPLTQALLRIWQVQQGLPRAAIFSIRQTADGYIWLGTQAGLYRFDGVRFTAVNDARHVPLTNLWIQDLQEDADHNLWVATDNAGLIRLRDGVATYYDKTAGLPSNQVRRVLIDKQKRLWVGTDAGLARWDRDKFTVFPELAELGFQDIRALTEASDGSIWIGGEGHHLCEWNGNTFTSHVLASITARDSVQSLLGTSDGTIWIGTSEGVIRWQSGKEKHFARNDGLADDWVHCLTAASDGSIWVGTKDGLSRLRGDEIESFRTRDGLSQSTVFTLWEDHEGSLWAGTKHGLNQFIDRRTVPFTVSEGLPSNDAGPVLQDRAGNIWVGTLGAGLARYDGRHFTVAAILKSGLPSNTVLSLAEGAEDSLWIGTDQGLSHMRGDRISDTFTVEQGLPSNVIRSISRDHTGTLWVGTSAGLAEYRDGKFVPPAGDKEILGLPVQALIDYRGQSMLLSTEGGGVYRVADHRVSLFANDARVSRGVNAFFQDQEGLLWTAVRGSGLGLLNGDKTFSFTVKDGLYDDDVFGIVADDAGRLWMACSRGIFSVERKELLQFAAGEITKVNCIPFSPTDGLRTIECRQGVQPAIWKMTDGRVWFSTIRGVIVIDPVRFQRKLPPPPVLVEEVHVNGKDELASRFSTLPPDRTNIDFRYTALSLISPTRITFRYMLEGFDKDWIDAGLRREAFYTNLPPGSYRFRVGASNGDGAWSEAARPVKFTLQPHFYQTRWFVPLLILLSALIGWGLFRLRVRQIKSKMLAVLGERSRIARELHDTLIQGFSGVTMQMQGLMARLKNSPERQTLEDIIHDAGDCLREARHSVAGLRNTVGDESGLAASIAQAARQLTEAAELELHLRLGRSPVGLTADAEYNILRIVQEAVLNAVKHSSGRKMEVILNASAQQLLVSVRDDGVGFEMLQGEPCLPGHYGLIGMRERATHIQATLQIESDPGRGTTVSLMLPLVGNPTTMPVSRPQPTEAALETSS